jgi:hypothetical protein
MNNPTGAQRPALTRKPKWIAVAAIVLILGLGTAAYAQYTNNWFGMGSDNVMGVMPPNYTVPNGGGGHVQQPPPCAASGDITLTQSGAKGRTITYVSSKSGCIYTIKRDGTPWVTVTYNTSSKTYRLTDPNGTGGLLLELGTPAGLFSPHSPNPGPTTIKNPN